MNGTAATPSTKAPSSRRTTCVNGIGMYHSWRRNFNSPFFAILDIFDNAVGAGCHGTVTDRMTAKGFKGRVDLHNDVSSFQNEHRTDLVIMNNSLNPICNLEEILEIHKSNKGDKSDSIGQNGVGLKQGCAALTDLSFVFVRNHQKLSMGIIAKSLQHEAGCYLPSFDLPTKDYSTTDGSDDIKAALVQIFSYKDNADVVECVKSYGFGSLDFGLNLLTKHFYSMVDKSKWGKDDYVFGLVISGVRDGENDNIDIDELNHTRGGSLVTAVESSLVTDTASATNARSNNDTISTALTDSVMEEGEKINEDDLLEEERMLEAAVSMGIKSLRPRRIINAPAPKINTSKSTNSPKLSDEEPFVALLNELQTKLPKYYIHIPDAYVVTCNGSRILFKYWQQCLVSMMRFDVKMDKKIPFHECDNLAEPGGPDCVNTRIFCGFDPGRIDDEVTTLSVYIYSRVTGRLIKHTPDGRNLLGLNASGTMYCQGLTCLIDDYNGALPLNPTKQDIAFSERKYGQNLSKNLYNWTSAVIGVYYRWHLNTKFDQKKADITTDLKKVKSKMQSRKVVHRKVKPLAEADFDTLLNIKFTVNSKKKELRAILNSCIIVGDGEDTVFKLKEHGHLKNKNGDRKSNGKGKKRKLSNTTTSNAKSAKPSRKRGKSPIHRLDLSRSVKSESNQPTCDNDSDYEDNTQSNEDLLAACERLKSALARSQYDVKVLHDENEKIKSKNEELEEEVEYLTAKRRSLERKFAAERNLRISIEADLETEERRATPIKSEHLYQS